MKTACPASGCAPSSSFLFRKELASGLTLYDATAINDAGQIVGDALDTTRHHHAILLTPDGGGPPHRSIDLGVFRADPRRPQGAFTLIELLVGIAVISVLIALLLPGP